jgi:serine/threonine protein kinase
VSVSTLSAALASRYRLEGEIGAGGMATVSSARDLKHDRDVALKVLRADLGEALGRERFLREIRLAASLTHPHILPLHDSGDASGMLWFTMPLMSGDTLRDRMTAEGRLAVEEVVRLTAEVADALDYTHRRDVVHRDIKPENILLHEGHAIVADLGIGKAMVAATAHSTMHTQVGVTVGTPAYMSPEQAAGEEVDGRSDLFALGCVLFEMLTGEVAFNGPTVQATIARRFVHTPPPVHTVRPDVLPALARMVDGLLALEAILGIMQLRTGASREPALIASIEREARALIAEAPAQSYGYALLGFLAYENGDQITAVQSLRRAVALDPADDDIRFFLGIALQAGGQTDVRVGFEWLALDPLSPLANILVAANSWFTGRFAEGLAPLEEAVRLAPVGLIFHWGLGNHYALMGRYDAAARQVAWLVEHAAHLPYTAQLAGLVASATGREDDALECLATIDETKLDGHHTFHLGESYIMAGAHERGIALLARAVEMGFYQVDYLVRFCPFFVAVRGRDDFARVVERARERAAEFAAAVG